VCGEYGAELAWLLALTSNLEWRSGVGWKGEAWVGSGWALRVGVLAAFGPVNFWLFFSLDLVRVHGSLGLESTGWDSWSADGCVCVP
jgi:hypothetical protein